ncbi:MAG: EVE domain-containing protein [Nitrosopumilaceae archaeon]
MKQEPSSYSFDILVKEKKTIWDGVHNNLALKYMNQMKKSDLAFFYHTGEEKQVVGIIKITSKAYPNPEEKNERFVVVNVQPLKRLKRPVTLEEIRKDKRFKTWELLHLPRLSVMPVPKQLWNAIIEISKS